MEYKAVLRNRNQLTIPADIVRRLGIQRGDRLILELGEDERSATIRPIQRSYAGMLRGLYGTSEQVAAYIRGERKAWD